MSNLSKKDLKKPIKEIKQISENRYKITFCDFSWLLKREHNFNSIIIETDDIKGIVKPHPSNPKYSQLYDIYKIWEEA